MSSNMLLRTDSERVGNLVVHVIEARNIRPAHKQGTIDPYVKVKVGKHKIKSLVVKRNDTPRWDERLELFGVASNEEIRVTVYDKDVFIKDSLGEVTIPMAAAMAGKKGWFELGTARGQGVGGEIHLALSFGKMAPGADAETDRRQQQWQRKREEKLRKRVEKRRKKTPGVRRRFGLGVDDEWLTEYSAGMRHRGLMMHGRLYVTQNHLCFASFFLGTDNSEVVPFKNIIAIDKGRDFVNPTVDVHVEGRTYKFGSFMSRDAAYNVLTRVWRDVHNDDLAVIKEEIDTGSTTQRKPMPRRISVGAHGEEVVDEDGEDEGESDETEEDDEEEDEDEDYDENAVDVGFLPESNIKMHEVLCRTLACDVGTFFRLFVKEPDFTREYHEQRKDTNTTISEWRDDPQFGHIRDVAYIAPIVAPIGPKQTRMEETQRYHRRKDSLLLQTTAILRDVPYGNSFTVANRWEVNASGDGTSCTLTVGVGLYWTKSCWLKSKIESRSVGDQREAYQGWLKLAEAKIAADVTSGSGGEGGTVGSESTTALAGGGSGGEGEARAAGGASAAGGGGDLLGVSKLTAPKSPKKARRRASKSSTATKPPAGKPAPVVRPVPLPAPAPEKDALTRALEDPLLLGAGVVMVTLLVLGLILFWRVSSLSSVLEDIRGSTSIHSTTSPFGSEDSAVQVLEARVAQLELSLKQVMAALADRHDGM